MKLGPLMQILVSYLLFLWNGGLDPNSADLIQLRERRILSGIVLLILPVGIIIIIGNFSSGAPRDNWFLYLGQFFLIAALFAQAYGKSQQLAANLVFFTYWMMPALLMQRYGVQGTTMVWLLPVSPLAVLALGRRNGAIWAVLCSLTFLFYGKLHSMGLINYVQVNHEYVPKVGISNAVEMVMLTVILTGAAIIFRRTQRHTEAKLSKLVQKLRKEVHSRRLAEQDAKLSEQSKTAFLSSMSHEIRTPLNGVIAATRLMTEATSIEERKEFADIALLSSDTLLELVSDIMDLDAMGSGKLKISSDVIDPRSLVKDALWPLQFQAREKGIELNINIEPNIPQFIMGDRTRSKQIIINLAGNGIKFTQKGSVDCKFSIHNEMILVEVEDSGIGIDKQAQSKLFEPFVQADSSTRNQFGGSGLGLTIVKRIVSAMKGKIELESEMGKGTKISVYLPLIVPPQKTIDAFLLEQNKVSKVSSLRPLDLLIADDNAVNRMVLERLLEKDNHKVVSVEDGKQALDYLEAHDVDVVLLDIQMPIMNGEEAAQKIRELDGLKSKVPIIAITANANSDDAQRLLATNFNAFVAKPFKHQELTDAIQDLL